MNNKAIKMLIMLFLCVVLSSSFEPEEGVRERTGIEVIDEDQEEPPVPAMQRPLGTVCNYHMECVRPLFCLDSACAIWDTKKQVKFDIIHIVPKCKKHSECEKDQICIIGNCRPKRKLG